MHVKHSLRCRRTKWRNSLQNIIYFAFTTGTEQNVKNQRIMIRQYHDVAASTECLFASQLVVMNKSKNHHQLDQVVVVTADLCKRSMTLMNKSRCIVVLTNYQLTNRNEYYFEVIYRAPHSFHSSVSTESVNKWYYCRFLTNFVSIRRFTLVQGDGFSQYFGQLVVLCQFFLGRK